MLAVLASVWIIVPEFYPVWPIVNSHDTAVQRRCIQWSSDQRAITFAYKDAYLTCCEGKTLEHQFLVLKMIRRQFISCQIWAGLFVPSWWSANHHYSQKIIPTSDYLWSGNFSGFISQWSSSSYNLMVFSRCSTSATPCTTTMASWSAWTSTASCAEKELSLTSRPWPATIQRMLSLARNHQVCMELSSSGKSPKIIKENLPWILTQKNCQFPKVWFQDNIVCAELDE